MRSFLRTPSFLVAALLTLALGIGSTAAIFSIAYSVLFKPLPYPAADRLFALASTANPRQTGPINALQTGEVFHYLRDRVRSFENIAAYGGAIGWNLSMGTQAEHVTGMTVSRGYFDVMALGATAALVLRGFLAEGLSVALVGLAAGLLGAAFATRLLSLMIFDVAPQDPLTLVVVSVVLMGVAVVSTLIPSVKAARTNPAHVIRTE